MRNHRKSSAAVGFAAAACLFALAALPASAQQAPTGPPPAGVRDPFAEVRERQQREAQLRSAEMLAVAKPTDRRAAEAAAEQMREDFRLLQVLRNKIVRHLKSEKQLDYKFIAEETGDINKRAERLKTHLVRDEAPEAAPKEPEKIPEMDEDKVTDALVRMCRRIDSFTENPVFKLPDVVDVEQTAKAGRDLRDIIRLSGRIRKTAERLNKTQGR